MSLGTLPALGVRMPRSRSQKAGVISSRWEWATPTRAPAEASPEEGEATFETLTQMVVELVRELAEPASDAR